MLGRGKDQQMKLFMGRGARVRTGTLAFAAAAATLAFAGNAVAAQAPVPLATAAPFAILAGTGITNSGVTTISGDAGSTPTPTETGFTACPGAADCVVMTGTNHTAASPNDSATQGAKADLILAFDNATAQTPTSDISGRNLAGELLGPGVYSSTTDISLSGPTALTLDGRGNADSVFIFQAAAAKDLSVGATSTVRYINGAQPCNVFWKVQSAFLTNTGFTFVGTILALTQITLTDNITVEGRLLARNADVTLIHDTITRPTTCVTQASIDATSAAVAQAAAAAAAAQQAAEAAAATAAAAKAAADTAAAAIVKAAADAKAAADLAVKAAADAKAAKDLATAKAAAAKAVKAAKVAAAKATIAKKAAAKARAQAISTRKIARPARRHVGFTG
jgi:hypothetical protein